MLFINRCCFVVIVIVSFYDGFTWWYWSLTHLCQTCAVQMPPSSLNHLVENWQISISFNTLTFTRWFISKNNDDKIFMDEEKNAMTVMKTPINFSWIYKLLLDIDSISHLPFLFLAIVYRFFCIVLAILLHQYNLHSTSAEYWTITKYRVVESAVVVVFTFADMSIFRSIMMMMTMKMMMMSMMKRLQLWLSSPSRIWVSSGAFANSDPTCPHHPDPLCTWQMMTFMVTTVAFMMTKWQWYWTILSWKVIYDKNSSNINCYADGTDNRSDDSDNSNPGNICGYILAGALAPF